MPNGEKKVIIQPIGDIGESILRYLRERLGEIFLFLELNFSISKNSLPLKQSEYNASRGQYNGSEVMNKLLNKQYRSQPFRVLGVMDEDLYSKNLTFIFGLAKTSRKGFINDYSAALISFVRLKETYYGKPKNVEQFRERALKEAVHELGHTLGLNHCNNHCVMRFSNHLGQTDEKPLGFCDSCLKQLKNYL